MASVKITVADIVPGMYLVNPGLSWIKAPLVYMEEGLITSREEIDHIISQGYTEAYHDPSRFRQMDELVTAQEEDVWPDPKAPLVSLDEEIPKATAQSMQTLLTMCAASCRPHKGVLLMLRLPSLT